MMLPLLSSLRAYTVVFGMVLILGLIACRETPTPLDELIPEDTAPAITIVNPPNARLLNRSGEQVSVSFRLADKEGIKLFRAIPRLYNANDSLIGNLLPIDFEVEGENIVFDFDFTVLPANPFEKYEYICYVIDKKGAFAETSFWVSVLPDPNAPEPYRILSYENDSLKNPGSRDEDAFDFAMNVNAREVIPIRPFENLDTLVLQMDIAVNVDNPLTEWAPYLTSPNNAEFGEDSVFVVTNGTRFNYEDATYTTIFQAFFSDPAPSIQTPVLTAGDYVIVRLIKSPKPQFAVIKIVEIFDDNRFGLLGAGDYVVFDYKVTTP
ncbi:MAG: hypothetical protein AAF399_01465 [Bacteroidota bacterium]